ncbi:hypothetical protein [Mycobacterium sp. URHB0044]|uniref:hypothetical protein n=1 Tax=Mycobacterium sp. URHB0044 TaxID=1380386 RepID=UPI000688C132|nr:hypothetical protein [Mycobacterium sp. URHB0044]
MATMNPRADRLRAALRAMVAALLTGSAACAAVATGTALPSAAAQPPAGVDTRGFVNSAARCDPQQTAVVVGRTTKSLIAICADGRGRYEYRGVRLADQALQRLPATALANGCFGARTEEVFYTVSERKLLLTSGIRILRDEAMLEFKDYRLPAVAPVSQRMPVEHFR